MGRMKDLYTEGVTDLDSYFIGVHESIINNREYLARLLTDAGLLEIRNDVSGFWRGEEFVSFYDVLEGK
jgi:hypothetical protein